MTLREKIEVMQAFERDEEIESKAKVDITWDLVDLHMWDWANKEYRIKPKPKQVVVIEKWLFEDSYGIKLIQDIEKDCVLCYCHEFQMTKVKLLDTYEVEI